MLVMKGFVDCFVDAATAYERNEWHHLLDGNKRIELVGFTEQQLRVCRDVFANALGKYRGVFAKKLFGRRVMVVIADLNDGDAG